MRRLASALTGAALASALAVGTVAAGGPPGVGFYVDGAPYRTVGTPTDFSGTGAPDHSYDRIFLLGGDLMPVAESKPGDRDYNGGRWHVNILKEGVDPAKYADACSVDDLDLGDFEGTGNFFTCPLLPRKDQN